MYSTTHEVLSYLGKDALTKVRSETIGTGDGTTSTWTTSQINLISSSITLYTNSILFTGSYDIDLDEGRITYSAATNSVLSIDYDYSDIADSAVVDFITSTDALIEEKTGRKFTQETGSIEYVSLDPNQKIFYLKNYPILTLSSIETRDGDTYTTLNAGYIADYVSNTEDLKIGRIKLMELVGYGDDLLRVTYDYGYATTPVLINELSKLLTIRQLANSAVYKSIFMGYDNFTPIRLDEIEIRIEELYRLFTKQEINLI